MSPFLQFDIALVILIVAAKAGGYLSYRLNQPSVLGELLVGVIVGPSLLDVLHWPFFTDAHLHETLAHLAEIGVLLLMFMAGLELHLDDLKKTGRVASLAGTLGVFFPLLFGVGLGMAFSMGLQQAIFLGLILSATSVSISAQTLMEMGVLRSRVGISLLGAAVFDDILVVLFLSVFMALNDTSGGLLPVLWTLVRMLVFLGGAYLLGAWLLPRWSRVVDKLQISKGVVTFALVAALLFGWAAEVLGSMAAITGAFIAGLVLSRSRAKERIESGISTLAYAFFAPLFFINVGLSADARQITGQTVFLLAAMFVVAIAGKLIGAGWGARLGGLTGTEALQLGAGMMSRGEVGLIVASVGLANQMITPEVFAAVVGVVILTTLVTPPALRYLFKRAGG